MDDAQNGEIPKTRVEHTELNKIPGKRNVQVVTSDFLQSTIAIITPIKTHKVKIIHNGLFSPGKMGRPQGPRIC